MHSLTWFMHGKLDIMIYFGGGAFFPPPWKLSFSIFGMGLNPPGFVPPHEISHCVFEQYLDIKTGHDHFIC